MVDNQGVVGILAEGRSSARLMQNPLRRTTACWCLGEDRVEPRRRTESPRSQASHGRCLGAKLSWAIAPRAKEKLSAKH